MTPIGFYIPYSLNSNYSDVFFVDITGFIDDTYTIDVLGLRPVINLKSTLKFTGDGTKNNPYIPSI